MLFRSAGESWAFCAAGAREAGCRTFSYALLASSLDGVRVSPDGRAVVAFGFAFRMLDYSADWAAVQAREWSDSPGRYVEPPYETANLFMTSQGAFSQWRAPEALNALGRVRDVAFSADGASLALATADGLYYASIDGADVVRTPFAIDDVQLRGVAWRGDDVLIVALSDLSLAAVRRDGAPAWERLELARHFTSCDNPDAYPEDYENHLWLAADPATSLAVLGRGDCAIVVDTELGAPITGTVRLNGDAERTPLLFDRPHIRADGSALAIDFYWTTFTRAGYGEGQHLGALTGRVDGSLVSSLTALEASRR